MAGHAATGGEDCLGKVHPLDIFRGGLITHQNDSFAGFTGGGGFMGGKIQATSTGAGGSGQASRKGSCLFQLSGIKVGVHQGFQLLGLYLQHGFFFGQHAFVHQVNSNLHSSGGGTLAVTGLQHVQFAALNGKFHVLHVAVVLFQDLCILDKLVVHFGHFFFHVRHGMGGADTGNHVFALGVHQVFAVEFVFAGGGVAGEGNTSAAVIAHVAKHHALYVNGSAPITGDVVHTAVVDGAGVIPGTEHSLDGFHQLGFGILGKFLALCVAVNFLVAANHFFQVFGVQVGILGGALLAFNIFQSVMEQALVHFHHHVGKHLDKAAVAVVSKALVVGEARKAFHSDIVKAQVKDSVHHTGHGGAGTGAHGYQERILHIAKLLAELFFSSFQRAIDFFLDFGSDGLAIVIITGAGFGGNGKALWYGQTDVSHLRQVSAFAAQQVAHGRIAFFEQVYIFCHE